MSNSEANKMNIFSLFEDEELANILAQVIINKRPKSDLEKTKWWDCVKLQSFKDKHICSFIVHFWPTLDPKFILHELSNSLLIPYCDAQREQLVENLPNCLKNTLINKSLIKTIKEEQKEIIKKYNSPINGPRIKGSTNQWLTHRFGSKNIHDFLFNLGSSWINSLNLASSEIECDHGKDEEMDAEIAEIIFSNFPKTFDICEKEYHLYICGWNWNFTKGQEHKNSLIAR